MKIYLDSCSLQRPLDSRTQVRIALEAEAVLGIIALCEAGQLDLISSDALEFEMAQISHSIRREHALATLGIAAAHVELGDQIEQRARYFIESGIKPMDALHLGSAEAADCDYFCTCDDRFLRRAKEIIDLQTTVVSPLELVEELEI
jgi:predicted nucleic acid-binding protein